MAIMDTRLLTGVQMGNLGGPITGSPMAGSYNWQPGADRTTQSMSERLQALVGALMKSLGRAGQQYPSLFGDDTTTVKGSTTGEQATKSVQSLSQSQMESIVNNMMSTMSGVTTGVTTGVTDRFGRSTTTGETVSEVIGDKSDVRFGEALDRIAAQRAGVLERFAGAEKPLQEVAGLYAPGGQYGEGARASIEAQFKQALAASQTSLAQSGMHSGSMMEGIRTGMTGEKTRLLQGVEDTRQDRLGGILQQISGLRAAGGATVGAMQDPSFGGFIGPTGTRTVSTGGMTTREAGTSRSVTDSMTQQVGQQVSTQDIQKLLTSLGQQAGSASQAGTMQQTTTQPNQSLQQILGMLM